MRIAFFEYYVKHPDIVDTTRVVLVMKLVLIRFQHSAGNLSMPLSPTVNFSWKIISQRQIDLAKRWNAQGLLGGKGLDAVTQRRERR